MGILKAAFWSAWSLIFYTYALFPLLLAWIARRWGSGSVKSAPAEGDLPRVAMVVAAFDEEQSLPDKLANTWRLDYPADRLELLIGSDGSTDRTTSILRDCHDFRLRAFSFADRRGKIAVLNDLVARTEADILVMSDANSSFQPDALRLLVRRFQDASVGCVSGQLGLEQDGGVSGEGLYWKYEAWIKRSESRLGALIGCNGGIYALRRELYRPLPENTVVEDFVLSMQVLEQGRRVVLESEARATEPPCPSARSEMVRKTRIGAGGYQALALTRSLLHPRFGITAFAYWGHKVLRWGVPLFLIAALLSNAGLAVTLPLYRWLLLAQLLGVLVALSSYSVPQWAPPRWVRPVSYFYLMNFALLCGFFRYLFRTQRVTWERTAR
jgi:cellulose synthase/poly-beta-1,6-N-acetylglucosamine synthase-like glycosyltransferase